MAKKWHYYVSGASLFVAAIVWSITGIGIIVGIPLFLLSLTLIHRAWTDNVGDEQVGLDSDEHPWWLTWGGFFEKIRGNR